MKKTAQGKEEIHMTELLKLPVGIENFEEIRRDNFCAVFFHHCRYDLIRRVIRVKRNDVIGYLIHYMNGTGAGVQHDVVAVQLILMYHSSVLLVQKKCRLNRRQLFENCN